MEKCGKWESFYARPRKDTHHYCSHVSVYVTVTDLGHATIFVNCKEHLENEVQLCPQKTGEVSI